MIESTEREKRSRWERAKERERDGKKDKIFKGWEKGQRERERERDWGRYFSALEASNLRQTSQVSNMRRIINAKVKFHLHKILPLNSASNSSLADSCSWRRSKEEWGSHTENLTARERERESKRAKKVSERDEIKFSNCIFDSSSS